MNTFWKYLQYGYLVIGLLFIEGGISDWNTSKQAAFIKFGFAIFIILIFFFKRHFRRKIAKRNQQ